MKQPPRIYIFSVSLVMLVVFIFVFDALAATEGGSATISIDFQKIASWVITALLAIVTYFLVSTVNRFEASVKNLTRKYEAVEKEHKDLEHRVTVQETLCEKCQKNCMASDKQ